MARRGDFVFTILSDDEEDEKTKTKKAAKPKPNAKAQPQSNAKRTATASTAAPATAAAAAAATTSAAGAAMADDSASDEESEFETLAHASALAQLTRQKQNQRTNAAHAAGKTLGVAAPTAAAAAAASDDSAKNNKRKRGADSDAPEPAETDETGDADGSDSIYAPAKTITAIPVPVAATDVNSLFSFDADDDSDALSDAAVVALPAESWEAVMRRDTRLREAALKGNSGTDLATKVAARLEAKKQRRKKEEAKPVPTAAAAAAIASGAPVDEDGVPIEDGGEVDLDLNNVSSGSDDDTDIPTDFVPPTEDGDGDGEAEDADADDDAAGDDDDDDDGDADSKSDTASAAVSSDSKSAASGAVSSEAGVQVPVAKSVKPKAKPVVSAAFLASERDGVIDFSDLKLSRPLLRACKELGFVHPTPVQRAVIPTALTGADVMVNAVTGSGKTAAFMLPILERFVGKQQMYRVRHEASSVLVLTPTRELAAQCHAMTSTLAKHIAHVKICLVVGGLSQTVQATALLHNPDIIIATPGRIIDHIRNTRTFNLDGIQVLVLDEADRLLEENFNDEVREVVKACPRQRQTMLFSATLSEQVKDLVNLSLNNPKRFQLDSHMATVDSLEQEFVRIRNKTGDDTKADREAIVLALCMNTFKSRVIIFAQTKVDAHRMMVIFLLCELKAAELHGNLTQNQRLDAVEHFRDGKVDFLICTDLAARGIDIKNVDTVINVSLPRQLSQYVHRVGRTARAGRAGRSITLIDESQRKPLKEIMKQAKEVVKSRPVPHDTIQKARALITELETDIEVVIKQEKYEKYLRMTQIEAEAALNKINHRDEIHSRPAKTWFQTSAEKIAAKATGSRIVQPTEADVEAERAALAAAAAYKSSKEAKKLASAQNKPKKEKKDPLEGLSRAKKRRKLLLMEDAKEQAEEKAAAEAAGKKYISPAQRARIAIKQEKRSSTRAELSESGGNKPEKLKKRGVTTASRQPNRYDTGAMHDLANPESGFNADSRYRDNRKNARRIDAQFKKLEDSATKAQEAAAAGKKKGVKKGSHAFKSKARHKRR